MSIGTNIRSLREEKKLTQEKLAEMVDVTFQAVSAWERDIYLPETDKLIRLAEALDVSLSAIVDDRIRDLKTTKEIFNWEHMKTHVKTTARNLGMYETLRALDFAAEAHGGQKRKNSEVPYIYHPLNVACHALAMNITDDEIIAACLLHDVVEDCGKRVDDLPVNDEVKRLVLLVSHEKTTPENRGKAMKAYFDAIAKDPKASLIKCLDRCNNLTTISWGLGREKQYRMLAETEKYFPTLLSVIKADPRYNNASWLLQYQMESMLDIYKRMI